MPARLGAVLCVVAVMQSITGAFADPGPFPGRAEFQAFFDCEHREALKQDDGKTETNLVAAKVAALCKTAFANLAAAQKRYGYPPLNMSNFDYAVEEVHGNRVAKFRAAHPNQETPQNKLGH